METRKITIISTRDQSTKVIETGAETLAELKAVMHEKGIAYEGMAFHEGISKTILEDDAAQLPKNVMFRGAETNDLVFILTTPNKQIKSGAISFERAELYKWIKDNHLERDILEKLGRVYVSCPTEMLESYKEDYYASLCNNAEEEESSDNDIDNTRIYRYEFATNLTSEDLHRTNAMPCGFLETYRDPETGLTGKEIIHAFVSLINGIGERETSECHNHTQHEVASPYDDETLTSILSDYLG